jgi:hypothetical protein
MRAAALVLALNLSFSFSCGSSDDTTSDDPLVPGAPDAAIQPQPDAAVEPPDEPDAAVEPSLADEIEDLVVGDYVLRLRLAAVQEAPFIGAIDTVTTSIGIARIARQDDDFVLTEQGCRVESDSGDTVVTTIPDEIPRSTPPAVAPLEFRREGDALRWSRAEVITLVSVVLADPANDALPTEASDSRVTDQDSDGQPGVTVHVSGLASGDIYVVQRNRVAYEGGIVEADGRFVALAADASDQSVIGASNPMLNQNVPTSPNPDPALSTVVLAPVGEAYDCDRAIAEADSLFP